MLDRRLVLQTLLDQKKFKNYLEIGVFRGTVFFKIAARHKIAVDPTFQFSTFRRLAKGLSSVTNLTARYIEKTSDDFFAQDAPRLYKSKNIDIALIDGMHKYQFALRDVESTLRYLQPNGVIVMHDCNPQSAQAAESYEDLKKRNFEGDWNGDVWKTIVHLRSMRDDVHVFTLDCDHGLGIITKGNPENMLPFNSTEIEKLSYSDLTQNRHEFLNLKQAAYFYEHFRIDLAQLS